MEKPPLRRPLQVYDPNRLKEKRKLSKELLKDSNNKKKLKTTEQRIKRSINMTNRDDTYMNALLRRSSTARNNNITTTRLMSPLTQRSKLSKENCNSNNKNKNNNNNNKNNSCSSLTQTRVQKRKKEYCLDEWAALYGESPVNSLSVDCLYHIFEYCNNIKTLSVISKVCKRWRDIVLDPFLWRNLLEKWDSFLDVLYIINQHPMHHVKRQLLYTRTIRMLDNSNTTINRKSKKRNNIIPTIQQSLVNNSSLLKNITRLFMARMYFDDILDLIRYTPSLQVLRCDKIRTNGRYMMLHFFADLHKLQVLDLRFRESCEHTNYAFTLSDRRIRKTLSTTLKEFRMTGVYDREEIQSLLSSTNNPHQLQQNQVENQVIGLPLLLQQQQLRRRQHRLTRQMDDTLVERYQSLGFLVSLRSLCLGRCNAYTARVWRECIKPCVSNLEHLSLSGWRTPNKDTQETELAIQEMIQELKKIKSMELLDFECDIGVVNGIKKLDYRSIEASFHDNIHSNNNNSNNNSDNTIFQILSTPDILLKRKVHICKINF